MISAIQVGQIVIGVVGAKQVSLRLIKCLLRTTELHSRPYSMESITRNGKIRVERKPHF